MQEVARKDEVAVSVELAVADIRYLKQESHLRFALGVGEIVVRRLFKGDIRALRRRGPKDVAISRLAESPALPISVASLYVAVKVYELIQRLRDLETSPDLDLLTLSHYQAVLGVPPHSQAGLLKRAHDEVWSVARTRSEAAALARLDSPHGEAPPLAPAASMTVEPSMGSTQRAATPDAGAQPRSSRTLRLLRPLLDGELPDPDDLAGELTLSDVSTAIRNAERLLQRLHAYQAKLTHRG